MPQPDNRGGKREGAGRKPGHRFERRLLSAPAGTVASTEVRSPAVKIGPDDPALLSVIAMRARGLPWAEIERRTGRDADTCKRWCLAYPELVEAEVRKFTSPEELLAPIVPDAIRVLREIVNDEDVEPSVRLSAIKDTLDRAFGKVPVRQQGDGGPINVTITFSSYTPPLTIENDPDNMRQFESRTVEADREPR